jgi:hypothetical protein
MKSGELEWHGCTMFGAMAVNDRVAGPVADGTGPAGPGVSAAGQLCGLIRRHRAFAAVLAAAAVLRVVVMFGYPPAMFFNDSYFYMTDAVTRSPDIIRSSGYPLLLYLLPFRSLSLVAGLQAVMGLTVGGGIYAVLRRRGLPWWGAAIPALPVLFDVFELQLEHMVASDVLFYALVTAVLMLLCWWDRPPLLAAVIVGLATGYAATVRNVGEMLLAVVLTGMLLRGMGWRRIAAAAVAGLVPIAGYMVWSHAHYGHYALNEATGTFLYSRVSSFADCSKMNPPPDLRVLCDSTPPSQRPGSQEYLWANDEADGTWTPLRTLTGTNKTYRFTPRIESLTMRFAERAIQAQPLDYARVVVKDTLTTFGWTRENVTNSTGNLEGSGSEFRFEPTVRKVPGWITSDPVSARAARDFGGSEYGRPSVIQPWARFLWAYQKVVYLRGTFLLLFVLAGATGVALGVRRKTRVAGSGWGGLALLPWLTGVALIVLPPMTAGFSYRYVLAAVPAICLAAGLAFAGRGNLLTWLAGHGLPGRAPRGAEVTD